MRQVALALIAAAIVLMASLPAYAYLDVHQSSLLIQALVGGFAGLAVLARSLWRWALSRLARSR